MGTACATIALLSLLSLTHHSLSSLEDFCDCYTSTDGHPFNLSCFQNCYMDKKPECGWAEESCEIFAEEFLKLRRSNKGLGSAKMFGPRNLVDSYLTHSSTVIGISQEIDMRFSFDGTYNYSCNLTISSLDQEEGFLRKCYHYSDSCYDGLRYPDYFFVDLDAREEYKACLFNHGANITKMVLSPGVPTHTQLTSHAAVKMQCDVLDKRGLQTIEFPVNLKVNPIYGNDEYTGGSFEYKYRYPTNDIDLEMRLTKVSSKLFAVHLSWSCPSTWNGIPDIYKIVCARVLPSSGSVDDDDDPCDKCWKLIDNYEPKNHSNYQACNFCWSREAGHLDRTEGGHLYSEPKDTSIFRDSYIAYPVSWRIHNTTFLVYDCGIVCEDDETVTEDSHFGMHIWPNSNASDMALICAIKAKNLKPRKTEKEVQFGDESDQKPVGKLSRHAPQKLLQLKLKRKPGICSQIEVLDLEVHGHDLVRMNLVNSHETLLIKDGSYMFPIELQKVHSESLSSSGCFDWISQRWFFVKQANSTSGQLFLESNDDGHDWVVIYSSTEPQQVSCVPSKSQVFWTQNNGLSKTTISAAHFNALDGQLEINIENYHDGSNFFKSCAACSNIGALISSAFDVVQTFGAASLMVVTENGIWDVSLEQCLCELIVPAAVLEENLSLSEVQAFTVFSPTQLFVSTETEFFLLTLSSNWAKINKYFIIYKDYDVSTDLLNDVSGFPSYLLERILLNEHQNTDVDECSRYYVYQMNTIVHNFGHLPDTCILPEMRASFGGAVQFQMLSKTTANITIRPNFSDTSSVNCLKPPTSYVVRYGIVSGDPMHLECSQTHCPCDDPNIGPCKQTETQFTRAETISVTIGYLIPDQMYILEVYAVSKPLSDPSVDELNKMMEIKIEDIFGKFNMDRTFTGTFSSKYVPAVNDLTLVIAATLIPLALLLGLLIAVLIYVYKSRWYMYKNLSRIRPSDIQRRKKLGEGHFGEVWEAELICGKKITHVAVKQLNEAAAEKEKRQFLEEAIVLSKLVHPNIVTPMGICMSSTPVLLALEFLNGGSLQTYLRKKAVRLALNINDLFYATIEVCKACLYLESKGYIHRDISAKNCLVSTTGNSLKPHKVKLADFGLAKDVAQELVYSAGRDAVVPVPYTAPEGLFKGDFSIKSDIWSFAVLIWEIFSWGSFPFGRCYFPEDQLSHACPLKLHKLEEIELMVCIKKMTLYDFPDPCCALFSESLKAIMKQCWMFEPSERPTFPQLLKYLNVLKKEDGKTDAVFSIVTSSPSSQILPSVKKQSVTSAAYTGLNRTSSKPKNQLESHHLSDAYTDNLPKPKFMGPNGEPLQQCNVAIEVENSNGLDETIGEIGENNDSGSIPLSIFKPGLMKDAYAPAPSSNTKNLKDDNLLLNVEKVLRPVSAYSSERSSTEESAVEPKKDSIVLIDPYADAVKFRALENGQSEISDDVIAEKSNDSDGSNVRMTEIEDDSSIACSDAVQPAGLMDANSGYLPSKSEPQDSKALSSNAMPQKVSIL